MVIKDKLNCVIDERNDQFEIMMDVIGKVGPLKIVKNNLNHSNEEKIYYVINQSNLQFINQLKDKFLTNVILDRLQNNKNFYLMLYSSHESLDEKNFNDLKKYCDLNNIDETKIFLINNGANLNELQLKNSTNFNLHRLNVLSFTKISDMINSTESQYHEKKNGKFFMTFNKEDKTHRYALLILLRNNNFLDDTNWSFLPTNKFGINEDKLSRVLSKLSIQKMIGDLHFFQNLEFKFSDYENHLDYNLSNVIKLTMIENHQNYLNSHVNLTTESVFDERENIIHITEKSFKPFYYYQIPLILASENHIKKMKQLYDLDFYEDVIDYSYDSVKNDIDRLELYFKEVKRIYANKESIIKFYNQNKNRFEENKQKIINMKSLLKNDYDFFKTLI